MLAANQRLNTFYKKINVKNATKPNQYFKINIKEGCYSSPPPHIVLDVPRAIKWRESIEFYCIGGRSIYYMLFFLKAFDIYRRGKMINYQVIFYALSLKIPNYLLTIYLSLNLCAVLLEYCLLVCVVYFVHVYEIIFCHVVYEWSM